jgi:branched-chain amino acid aminotransferase
MTTPIVDEKHVLATILNTDHYSTEKYYAFYSSLFGGIIKNPKLMLIPIDDHMVHRGDGVFEAMKAISRSVYLMDEHLQRLFSSADKISLTVPLSFDQLKILIIDTLKAADQNDVLIRVFISRGPGNFSVDPYKTLGSQIYIAITQLTTPSEEKYEQGLKIGKSLIPTKPSWLAQIKSCNYLPNVMMKKEALDRSLDYVIGIDENGNLRESATENIMILDHNNTLVHPPLDGILKGTTMIRAHELAEENGINTDSRELSITDLLNASEVLITGTSLDVLPVVEFEGQKIGNGHPGPMAKKLRELIQQDLKTGPWLTAF